MKQLALSLILLLSCGTFFGDAVYAGGKKSKLPNILWITVEDMGPHLGCYGDSYADSPNIDAFAKKALRYMNCWSNAPVCAPARTTIISGMYPPSTGSFHMRSQTRSPSEFAFYPVLLRQLGYYCTNNVKEDYNLIKSKGLWDESSRKAHYKNRKPGQPFFAIFNLTTTHESQIRNKIKKLVHDPKKVKLPAYHPDAPEVRRDWAQYYDRITQMDHQVGELLDELAQSGELENTIIFFYSDHGSGMPRSKRHATNSGLHVPLLIHVPDQYKHLAPKDYAPGKTTNRLVSFVDLAPTLLSIAGTKAPEYYQGYAFMGKHEAKPRDYIHGFRGRMDERQDLVRSLRDQRYVYVRNYYPHIPHGQYVWYQFQTPTTRVWKEMFDAGKLNKAQSLFWQPKAPEELYDLETDPDEVINLVNAPEQAERLERFRKAYRDHVFRIRDVGFLPENEIHTRSKGSTPYEMGHNPKKYPLEKIFAMAQMASSLKPNVTEKLVAGMNDKDSAVRYWAVMGLQMRGEETVAKHKDVLNKALKDKAPSVRIAAAETLGKFGDAQEVTAALNSLVNLANPGKHDVHQCVMALNALDSLGKKVEPVYDRIKAFPRNVKNASDPRSTYGVPRLISSIMETFGEKDAKK